jgi:O-antigen ligase
LLAGIPQPWRPIATVPDAARNALLSLIVPLAALLLAGGCRSSELPRTLTLVLVLVMGSALVGVVQFSGAGADNPLINARPGVPSGFFANRNHQALLLAIGCLVAPVWALLPDRTSVMRLWTAAGCVALLLLMILATGSRAGLLLCGIALPLAALLVGRRARHALRRAPRWLWPTLLGACVVAFAILVVLSVAAERAESLRRIVVMEPGQDMRSRALPVMMQMLGTYFPVGFGFGGFDPIFRLHEPLTLLKLTYFNHAHDDFVEAVLAGGLPALLLLLAAVGWWLMSSVRAWRTRGAILPRLGSAIVLLVLTHSPFDYPARTPLIMALIILAALWMTSRGEESEGSRGLPKEAIRL